MTRYFLLLVQFFASLCSYFFKKDSNILLFWAFSSETFSGNPKYLFLYAIDNFVDKQSYWVTANKDLYLKMKNEGLPCIYKFSLRWFIIIAKAGYIFIDHWVQDVLYSFTFWMGRYNIIQTWHWTPLKQIGLSSANFWWFRTFATKREFSSYKKILAPSDVIAWIFQDVFQNNSIIITGSPRNDVLFQSKNGYSNYKKVFLYAPTFRDGSTISPFSEWFLQKLDAFLLKNDYIFLIKLHPADMTVLDFDNYSSIIRLGNHTDLYDVLPDVDVLITDYSSVFADFMILNKPVIFYCYDYEFYIQNCRKMFFDYFEDLSWPFVKNSEDLLTYLTNFDWKNDVWYLEKYMHSQKIFHKYLDSNSCYRVFEEVL